MEKKSSPEASGTYRTRPKGRHRRAFLAPAALAGLLAGGGGGGAAIAGVSAGEEADLTAVSEIERIGLIAGGAVSASPRIRLATARTLRHAPPSLGSLTAIEHLARDRDPLVRVAIAEAAWLRRKEAPTRLISVLHRLAEDDDQFVREVARLALGDV